MSTADVDLVDELDRCRNRAIARKREVRRLRSELRHAVQVAGSLRARNRRLLALLRTIHPRKENPMPLTDVLYQALRHFVHLDESNAAIHCAPVRYSPLTFRLAEHLAAVLADPDADWVDLDNIVAIVMSHAGQYTEDAGR